METKRKDMKEFAHIGGILHKVLLQYRRESDEDLLRIWQLWEQAVGKAIAENARPAAFKGNLLWVHVTSSTWVHQLQFLKRDIVEKLNKVLGKELVEEIKFKVGSI
jgi:predicted nucleic acid-binding Zn ribbon protein